VSHSIRIAHTKRRFVAAAFIAAAVVLALSAPVRAEDLKDRWYFGGNLAFLSTTDDIRSNAAILIGPLGDDGIPFTGDPNENQGCGGLNYCDPRPDNLLGRETTIEETFKVDFTAGYGLTSWLSPQLDASYYKGDVGPVDTYVRQATPRADVLGALSSVRVSSEVFPVQGGQLTQIPVSLTGIVRFRKDSPLNPYIGVGAGVIFAEMDGFEDVDALNDRLGKMRIREARNEFNEIIQTFSDRGVNPFIYPVSVNVQDAFEWHLTGGAEYFINDRFSLVFDARYTFADQDVRIDLAGEDQVNLNIWSEGLFREDGSQQMFSNGGDQANPTCGDLPLAWAIVSTQCNVVGGVLQNPSSTITCNPGDVIDFDGNGTVDRCYNKNIFTPATSPSGVQGFTEPAGKVVVQGGQINLTAFSVAIGARFHF